MEREKIPERTKAGLQGARKKGRILGQPNTTDRRSVDIVTLSNASLPNAVIAKKTPIRSAASSYPMGRPGNILAHSGT